MTTADRLNRLAELGVTIQEANGQVKAEVPHGLTEREEREAEALLLDLRQNPQAVRRALGLEPQGEEDPLAPLRALPEGADLEAVEIELRDLAVRASGRDRLGLALLREGAIRELERVGVSSPARLVDATLGAVSTNGEAGNSAQGQAVFLLDPEPWPDPVDGAALLDELQGTFERFVVLPEGASAALALAVMHTHAHEASDVSPRIGITSPTKRCGKSTLLTLLSHLVPRPLPTVNMSAASLFRAVEEYGPTLLVDEADRFLGEKEELIGLLNAGHHRPFAYVLRVVGDENEVRSFRVWAPAIIALIGRLPDTISDRAVNIPMRRKTKEEKVERLRLDRLGELEILQRKAWRWAQDHTEALRAQDPDVPSNLNDRAADNWRPLLAIADLAGGDWPQKAREAARILSGSSDEEDDDAGPLLLSDLWAIFQDAGTDWLPTKAILEYLHGMEDRPWPEWRRGEAITSRQLAKVLKPFGIQPVKKGAGPKMERTSVRGYSREQFAEAWKRYPPQPEGGSRSDTPTHPRSDGHSGHFAMRHTQGGVSGAEKGPTPHEKPGVSGVSLPNPPPDGEGDLL